MKRLLLLSTVVAGAAALTACGLKGDLVAPGPMWGDPTRTAAASTLPNQQSETDDRIVFTRDDVDLFRDEAPVEDPFEDSPPRPLPLGPESDRSPDTSLDAIADDSLADEEDE